MIVLPSIIGSRKRAFPTCKLYLSFTHNLIQHTVVRGPTRVRYSVGHSSPFRPFLTKLPLGFLARIYEVLPLCSGWSCRDGYGRKSNSQMCHVLNDFWLNGLTRS